MWSWVVTAEVFVACRAAATTRINTSCHWHLPLLSNSVSVLCATAVHNNCATVICHCCQTTFHGHLPLLSKSMNVVCHRCQQSCHCYLPLLSNHVPLSFATAVKPRATVICHYCQTTCHCHLPPLSNHGFLTRSCLSTRG